MADESAPTTEDLLGTPVNARDVLTTALAQPETLAALLQAMDEQEVPIEAADPLATALLDAVDKYIRKKIGPLPWVRRLLWGTCTAVGAGTCTMAVPGIDHAVTDVLYGHNRPTVGEAYLVRFPVALPPEGVPLAQGPQPFGQPWIKVPGGQRLFYAVGLLDAYPPHWPYGPTVGVMAMDWPLPTAGDVLPADLSASEAGSFDFSAHVPAGPGRIRNAARFIGVDGQGTVWAMLETQQAPSPPDSFSTTHADGSIEIGRTVAPRIVAFLASIPAAGTGTPDPIQTCPEQVVPLAVDATPGHSGLLSVSNGILVAREKCRDDDFFLPPAPHRHYCWEAIGNNGVLDHYTVSVGTVDSSRAVAWREAARVNGEGQWMRNYFEIGSKNSPSDPYTKIQSTTYPFWPETFREVIHQGHLDGFRQNSYFAYPYPALELAHTLWTDSADRQHWRAAFVTYPALDSKDGPLFLFDEDGLEVNGTSIVVDSTDPPNTVSGALLQRYLPIHQEERDVGRWATYIGEEGLTRTWSIGGLPYALWGAGPSGDGEWALVTRIPSRLGSATHDQTDLLAVLQTSRSDVALGSDMRDLPAHHEFTPARIIARSQDGQQVLAEDTAGTYNADEQSMSPGSLWQSTDGGVSWTRLAFRITDFPATAGQQAQGYGFIVEEAA